MAKVITSARVNVQLSIAIALLMSVGYILLLLIFSKDLTKFTTDISNTQSSPSSYSYLSPRTRGSSVMNSYRSVTPSNEGDDDGY